ncbi:glycoside hydrolase superfamily [Aspergillus multicolor]|uniref:glycoside hydrolase superfamily n=1 Tax=Aspergillus multicolor TaxID=41759 RepID=UPI003CCCBC29
MGATFDVELIRHVGSLLGDEGRRKGVQVALTPTVCIQRSPLIDRGFEAFAEGPLLSGTLARHYIECLQERNVAACIKHYAAHDHSTNAKEDDVHMTKRTLREIHLLPFQIAMQARPPPWAAMVAYQKIDGLHVSEDPFMLQQVLRDEWGFDGLVMSDWWGTYSVSEALNAGIGLEIPGPSIWRGRQMMEAVECRKLSMAAVDRALKNMLKLIERTWTSHDYSGEGRDTMASRTLTRQGHFTNPATGGGGSSETPFYVSTPLNAFIEVLGTENIRHEPGCYTRRWTPLIQNGLYQPQSRNAGLLLEWFDEDPSMHKNAQCVYSSSTTNTCMYFSQVTFPNVPATHYIRITMKFVMEKTCKYLFAFSVCGKAKLLIDGKETIGLRENHPEKTDDTPCFHKLSMERLVTLDAQEGREYNVVSLMTNLKPGSTPTELPSAGGVRLGGQEVRNEDKAIEDAVHLAKNVDIPILITGLSADYEYEASDRTSHFLPRREDEMI